MPSSPTFDSSQIPFYATNNVIQDAYCIDDSSKTQDVFTMESRNYIHANHYDICVNF